MRNESVEKNEKDYSLTGRAGMGGIVAGEGFDFQLRYILCRIVDWVSDPDFHQILHEGTGDVDVRYRNDRGERRDHIQVKDHVVTPAEFRDVLETFNGFDKSAPDVYQRFTLAAPDVSSNIKTLVRQIQRLRGAIGFYDTTPVVTATEREKIQQQLERLNLTSYTEFVIEKLDFDIELHNCHNDNRAREVFFGTMVRGKSDIWKKFTEAGDHIYDRLFTEMNTRRKQVISQAEFQAILDQLSSEIVIASREPLVATIGVHNWALEKLTPTPDLEVKWSEHFERTPKKVPTVRQWNIELVPELYSMKKTLLAEKGSGVVRIVGSGCLSTQVALGLVFRSIEGWVIETVQQPGNQIWRSDAIATSEYVIQTRETLGDPSGDAIVLLLSFKNDVQQDVESYLKSVGIVPRAIVNILPPNGAGAISIKSNEDAVALSAAVRNVLRIAQDKHGVKLTHLFMSGPQSTALFIGQQLTSMGRVQLYEYQDNSQDVCYSASCHLHT